MTDLSLSGLRPVGGGRLLRLLGSLSLHLSFGFGLGALLKAAGLDGGGSGRLSLGLALHGGLVGSGSGGLGTTTSLLSRHGFGDLLGSVALRLELSHLLWVNLQLLGRLGRGGLRGRGGGLSLDGLLLRLLLSHLGLRLGLGLSLRLCNLLRREAGSRILLVGGSHGAADPRRPPGPYGSRTASPAWADGERRRKEPPARTGGVRPPAHLAAAATR